jgi:hypothetical protein
MLMAGGEEKSEQTLHGTDRVTAQKMTESLATEAVLSNSNLH